MGLVGKMVRGGIAGAVGTAAMDLLWFRRYQAGGGEATISTWEFSASATDFGDDAPAPARVGKRLADTVHLTLPDSAVSTTNNVVHWTTGIGWGIAAELAGRLPLVSKSTAGVLTGIGAWITSYAALSRIGVYRPMRDYDSETLWQDLSAHLVFGSAVGAALTVVR